MLEDDLRLANGLLRLLLNLNGLVQRLEFVVDVLDRNCVAQLAADRVEQFRVNLLVARELLLQILQLLIVVKNTRVLHLKHARVQCVAGALLAR